MKLDDYLPHPQRVYVVGVGPNYLQSLTAGLFYPFGVIPTVLSLPLKMLGKLAGVAFRIKFAGRPLWTCVVVTAKTLPGAVFFALTACVASLVVAIVGVCGCITVGEMRP